MRVGSALFLLFLSSVGLAACATNPNSSASGRPAAGSAPTDYLAAAQQFENLARQDSTANGNLPRYSEPAAAGLIDTLSDSNRFLDSAVYSQPDIALLLRMCVKTQEFVTIYSSPGTSGKTGPELATAQAKNFVTYSNELVRLLPFDLRCFAKMVPLLSNALATAPPEAVEKFKQNGLAKAQKGATQVFASSLVLMATMSKTVNGLDPLLAKAILTTVADTAPAFVQFTPLESRRQILLLAQAVQKTTPTEFQPDLARIVKAMANTDCGILCQAPTAPGTPT